MGQSPVRIPLVFPGRLNCSGSLPPCKRGPARNNTLRRCTKAFGTGSTQARRWWRGEGRGRGGGRACPGSGAAAAQPVGPTACGEAVGRGPARPRANAAVDAYRRQGRGLVGEPEEPPLVV